MTLKYLVLKNRKKLKLLRHLEVTSLRRIISDFLPYVFERYVFADISFCRYVFAEISKMKFDRKSTVARQFFTVLKDLCLI